MVMAIFDFLLAGLAEIGGGYLVWLWIRESRPFGMGRLVALFLFCTASFLHCKVSRHSGESTLLTAVFSWFWRCYGGGLSTKKRPICTTG